MRHAALDTASSLCFMILPLLGDDVWIPACAGMTIFKSYF
jgi:hypothetical protein